MSLTFYFWHFQHVYKSIVMILANLIYITIKSGLVPSYIPKEMLSVLQFIITSIDGVIRIVLPVVKLFKQMINVHARVMQRLYTMQQQEPKRTVFI